MRLNDKVAIITGAGKGIGKAIVLAFAKEGAKVVLASRTKSDLENVKKAIHSLGTPTLAVPTDVTDERQVEKLAQQTIKTFGRIDILVNNAGFGVFSKIVNMKTKDFDWMMAVNLRGVFLFTRAVLPQMIKQEDGVIVNISSLAGRNAFVGGAGYCATKWGLIGFARSLMLEVREHKIRVITVCPGSVDTGFSDHSKDSGHREKILQPEDVAETILAAVTMPAHAMVSEIDIRPTNPK